MTPLQTLEAVLFAAGKPVSRRVLMQTLSWDVKTLEGVLEGLREALIPRGLQLVEHREQIELVTHADAAESIRAVLGLELQGELSRAALETLSILAYRGPLTRPEIEQIRGIQSSQILRHLSLRGLVEETGAVRLGQAVYDVTIEFFERLGLSSRENLPSFGEFSRQNATPGV
jgi:segregation and condensation protein B